MSEIVERLRSFKENVSNDMIELLETPEVCIQAANEIERLTEASKIDDAEKKRMSAEIGRLRADSVRLDWLLRNVSGKEFRRLGIEYEAGCSRHNIDVVLGKDNEPVQKEQAGE